MWRYRYTDELYHKFGFKYIDKILTDKGYRYIYDSNEATKRASRSKNAYEYYRRKAQHAKANLDNEELRLNNYNKRTSNLVGSPAKMTSSQALRQGRKDKRDLQKAYNDAVRQERAARRGLNRAYRQVKRANRRKKRFNNFASIVRKVNSFLSKLKNTAVRKKNAKTVTNTVKDAARQAVFNNRTKTVRKRGG